MATSHGGNTFSSALAAMAATSLLVTLLVSWSEDTSSSTRRSCSAIEGSQCLASSQCRGAPSDHYCPGWGETCCGSPAAGRPRCSDDSSLGYSCVPRASCRGSGAAQSSKVISYRIRPIDHREHSGYHAGYRGPPRRWPIDQREHLGYHGGFHGPPRGLVLGGVVTGQTRGGARDQGGYCPGWGEVCCRKEARIRTCSEFSELGYECVPRVQCDQGVVVTDGSGILNARKKEASTVQERSKCSDRSQVCCLNLPDFF